MSTVATESPLRRAISIPPGSGTTAYELGMAESFRVEAVSFTVDSTSAAGVVDVTLQFNLPTGDVIVEANVGQGQATGLVVRYAVSARLNPCDGATYSGTGLTPDTFADIVLMPSCAVTIRVVGSTSGSIDTGALIPTGIIWAADIGAASLADLAPVFIPVNIQDVTLAVEAGVGALEGLF